MNKHLIFLHFMGHVSVVPPKEAQKRTVAVWNSNLIKYRFYVRHNCNSILAKPCQHSNKWICQVRSLVKHAVEWTELCSAFEDYSNFSWLVGMVHPMVKYMLRVTVRTHLKRRNLTQLSATNSLMKTLLSSHSLGSFFNLFVNQPTFRSWIAPVLFYFALRLVQKTRPVISTSQMQNKNQSHFDHSRFPALQAFCSYWTIMMVTFVLIGSKLW